MLREDAVESLHLAFKRDQDDLDSFAYCVFETEAGTFAMRRNENQPVSGYKLIGMEGETSGAVQIAAFLNSFGMKDDVTTWRRPSELDGS